MYDNVMGCVKEQYVWSEKKQNLFLALESKHSFNDLSYPCHNHKMKNSIQDTIS